MNFASLALQLKPSMINGINIYQEESGNAEWRRSNAGGCWVQLWVAWVIKLGTLYVRGRVRTMTGHPSNRRVHSLDLHI